MNNNHRLFTLIQVFGITLLFMCSGLSTLAIAMTAPSLEIVAGEPEAINEDTAAKSLDKSDNSNEASPKKSTTREPNYINGSKNASTDCEKKKCHPP